MVVWEGATINTINWLVGSNDGVDSVGNTYANPLISVSSCVIFPPRLSMSCLTLSISESVAWGFTVIYQHGRLS